MKRNAHRIGAVFYTLWGLLHIVGGASILATLKFDGGVAALAMFGTGATPAEFPSSTTSVMDDLMAYHAFDILWIGLLTTVVAVFFNWRNSVAGYWVNLVVVSTFDLGLILFEVLPGSIAVADAMIGLSLWIPAVAFSSVGVFSLTRTRQTEAADAEFRISRGPTQTETDPLPHRQPKN